MIPKGLYVGRKELQILQVLGNEERPIGSILWDSAILETTSGGKCSKKALYHLQVGTCNAVLYQKSGWRTHTYKSIQSLLRKELIVRTRVGFYKRTELGGQILCKKLAI